jgi:hypothetical protein
MLVCVVITLQLARSPGKRIAATSTSLLLDAAEMVKRCEACQFHAKKIHQPAQGLQPSPLTWPFAI